ncbi:MAG: polyphosphate kinase 2 family protein [Bryobacteraceae bacterium]|nr:polyphosphate kinase 2 family protein [Bryobacteraceae bacterium]
MKSAPLHSIDKLIPRFCVPPKKRVSLGKDYDPTFRDGKREKDESAALLSESVRLLAEYQDMLYAQDRYALLIIFQAMDAAGKDGTIKHVMSGINPQGCQVSSFKAPTSHELDHDYLWRCVKELPERGRIGIFNRSYYEEVLVARVHPAILERQKLPPRFMGPRIWEHRYEEIVNFERYLHRNGTVILKFFLHVSKQEQKRRFLERIDKPEKNWKFSGADVQERQHWRQYMRAYEDCLSATSTKFAPWYVIPADDKPFMRLATAAVIVKALQGMDLHYPKVTDEHRVQLQEARRLLVAEGDK